MELQVEELPSFHVKNTIETETEPENQKKKEMDDDTTSVITSMPVSREMPKSVLKKPSSSQSSTNIGDNVPVSKPKKNVTYDTILENMGLYVYNGKLHELSKHIEEEEQQRPQTYTRINKKPKNIPQNGYVYSKYNKHYPENMRTNLQTQQPYQEQIENPSHVPLKSAHASPAAQEYQRRLIQKIVQNNITKRQMKQKQTLVLFN